MKAGKFFLLLAALALLPGCGGRGQTQTVKPQVHVLVFDPTVFEPGEGEELKKWMEGLSNYLKRKLPQRSQVIVFVVGEGMVKPPEVKYFEPRVEHGGEKKHKADVELYLQELTGRLEGAWRKAHEEAQVKIPASCIVSSLAAVERSLGVFPKSSEVSLVLLSDMVESCDDWGGLISFERGAAEIEKLKRVKTGVTLSRLSRVTVVQLPSRFAMTPEEVRMIESFWKSFFVEKAKVPEDRLSYLPSFPVEG